MGASRGHGPERHSPLHPASPAGTNARPQALDPTRLQAALDHAAVSAPSQAPALLGALTESAIPFGRSDLEGAAFWLADHFPPAGPTVIGHGDLHPLNLLVDGEHWTLLDWTSALVADPAYDRAFTTLMLRHPPLAAPAPLRPVLASVGAVLARRFTTAYQRAGGTPSDQRTLDWYTNFHALRILTEFEGWCQDSTGSDHSLHPWSTVGPVAAQILSRTTEMKVSFVGA